MANYHLQTIVAWVMVLTRIRYFRQHIIAAERKKSVLRSFGDRMMGRVSHVNHSNPESLLEDGHARHKSHGAHGIQASDGIGAAMAAGAVTGLGLGIALGNSRFEDANPPEASALQSKSETEINIHVYGTPQASPTEDITMDPKDDDERGVIADVLTSSPRSGAIELHPESPRSMQLQFATNVQPFARTTVRRRPGKRSFVPISPLSLIRRTGVPIPRRRTIMVPPKEIYHPSNPAIGQRNKDQGSGGFPGPIQLSIRITRRHFPTLYHWLSRLFDADQPERKSSLKWIKISESLKDLVIGRNSEFNTEELSDEQLEVIGGIE